MIDDLSKYSDEFIIEMREYYGRHLTYPYNGIVSIRGAYRIYNDEFIKRGLESKKSALAKNPKFP